MEEQVARCKFRSSGRFAGHYLRQRAVFRPTQHRVSDGASLLANADGTDRHAPDGEVRAASLL